MREKRTIEWSQIIEGEPHPEGRIVYGLGLVKFSERDESGAIEKGGDPLVEIWNVTSSAATMPQWSVGQMTPRDPAIVNLRKLEILRLKLLRWYYDNYAADPGNVGPPYDKSDSYLTFAKRNNLPPEEVNAAWRYLVNEKLLGQTAGGGMASITHLGIKEFEQTIKFPSQPTQHFGVQVNQHNSNQFGDNNTIGAVQAGSGNSAEVNQTFNSSAHDLAELIVSVRHKIAELPESEQSTAIQLVDTIEAEVVKDSPAKAVVDAVYKALPHVIQCAPELIKVYLKVFDEQPPI